MKPWKFSIKLVLVISLSYIWKFSDSTGTGTVPKTQKSTSSSTTTDSQSQSQQSQSSIQEPESGTQNQPSSSQQPSPSNNESGSQSQSHQAISSVSRQPDQSNENKTSINKTRIELDISKTLSTNEIEFNENEDGFKIFTPKSNSYFKCVKDDVEIWRSDDNSRGMRVVLSSPDDKSNVYLSILLSSNSLLIFKYNSKDMSWEDKTSSRHSLRELKFYTKDQSEYKEIEVSYLKLNVHYFTYAFIFDSVSCDKISYKNQDVWENANPGNSCLKGVYFKLTHNKFFLFNSDDKFEELKINKTQSPPQPVSKPEETGSVTTPSSIQPLKEAEARPTGQTQPPNKPSSGTPTSTQQPKSPSQQPQATPTQPSSAQQPKEPKQPSEQSQPTKPPKERPTSGEQAKPTQPTASQSASKPVVVKTQQQPSSAQPTEPTPVTTQSVCQPTAVTPAKEEAKPKESEQSQNKEQVTQPTDQPSELEPTQSEFTKNTTDLNIKLRNSNDQINYTKDSKHHTFAPKDGLYITGIKDDNVDVWKSDSPNQRHVQCPNKVILFEGDTHSLTLYFDDDNIKVFKLNDSDNQWKEFNLADLTEVEDLSQYTCSTPNQSRSKPRFTICGFHLFDKVNDTIVIESEPKEIIIPNSQVLGQPILSGTTIYDDEKPSISQQAQVIPPSDKSQSDESDPESDTISVSSPPLESVVTVINQSESQKSTPDGSGVTKQVDGAQSSEPTESSQTKSDPSGDKKKVTLDTKSSSGTNQYDYHKDGKIVTFTTKSNNVFNVVKAKDSEIWKTDKTSECATKVVLKGKGNKTKQVTIHLPNSETKVYHKEGKGKPWVEGALPTNGSNSAGKIVGLNTNARELKEACQTLKKKCGENKMENIKDAAGSLESAAGDLQSNSTEDKALIVIQKYDLLLTEYNKLDDTKKSNIKTEFEQVRKLYDSMLKHCKVKLKAKVLVEKANEHRQLKEHSEKLLTAINTLITAEMRDKASASENLQNAYNTLGKEYNKVKDNIKPEVQTAYNDLKSAYMTSLSSSR